MRMYRSRFLVLLTPFPVCFANVEDIQLCAAGKLHSSVTGMINAASIN